MENIERFQTFHCKNAYLDKEFEITETIYCKLNDCKCAYQRWYWGKFIQSDKCKNCRKFDPITLDNI